SPPPSANPATRPAPTTASPTPTATSATPTAPAPTGTTPSPPCTPPTPPPSSPTSTNTSPASTATNPSHPRTPATASGRPGDPGWDGPWALPDDGRTGRGSACVRVDGAQQVVGHLAQSVGRTRADLDQPYRGQQIPHPVAVPRARPNDAEHVGPGPVVPADG